MAARVRPIHEFRVYPSEHGRLYYTVRVFKTVEQMRDFLEHDSDRSVKGTWGKTRAVCRSWLVLDVDSSGKSRRTAELGDICYNLNDSGIGTISHECLHATLFYLRRRKLWFSADALDKDQLYQDETICGVEEYSCWVLGRLVAEVVRKGYDCGWLRQ